MSEIPRTRDGARAPFAAIESIALAVGALAAVVATCIAHVGATPANAASASVASANLTPAHVTSARAERPTDPTVTDPTVTDPTVTDPTVTGANGSPSVGQGELEELFSHALHVRAEWWIDPDDTPEFAQDCRGCHVFDDRGAELDHAGLDHANLDQGLCFSCHLTSKRRFAPGPADGAKSRGDSFPHWKHRNLACRECHGPTPPGDLELAADATVGASVPLALPVPGGRGGAACESCHLADEGAVLDFELVRDAGTPLAERTLLLDGAELRERYLGRSAPTRFDPGTAAHFDHADHLDVTDGTACASCHTGFADSGATGSIEVERPERCQTCHVGTTFDFEEVSEPSRTAATFLHEHHVGAGLTCTQCHSYTPAQGAGVGSFGLSARFDGESMYTACADCHSGLEAAPAMPRRHGGESFRECGSCHAFTHPLPTPYAELRSGRPVVEVERPDPGGYGFTEHAHGCDVFGTRPGDCASCHWAPRDQRASNILGRAFDHRTHLSQALLSGGATATELNATCGECHADVARLSSPRNLAKGGHGLPDHVVAVFDPTTCGDCHGDEAAIELATSSRVERVEFDHAAHLARDGVTCLTCHETASADDAPLAFAASSRARDCTLCHGHVDAPDATGFGTRASNSGCDWNMSASDVDTCATCHTSGIPLPLALRDDDQTDEPVHHLRQRLTSKSGTFVHPDVPNGTACSSCHLQRDMGPAAAPPTSLPGGTARTVRVTAWNGAETRAQPRVVTNERGSSMQLVTSPHFNGSAEELTGLEGLIAILGEHGDVPSADVSLYFRDLFDRTSPPLLDTDQEFGRHCLVCHWSVTERQSEKFRRFQLPRNFRASEGLGAQAHWRAGIGFGTEPVRRALDNYRRALESNATR